MLSSESPAYLGTKVLTAHVTSILSPKLNMEVLERPTTKDVKCNALDMKAGAQHWGEC